MQGENEFRDHVPDRLSFAASEFPEVTDTCVAKDYRVIRIPVDYLRLLSKTEELVDRYLDKLPENQILHLQPKQDGDHLTYVIPAETQPLQGINPDFQGTGIGADAAGAYRSAFLEPLSGGTVTEDDLMIYRLARLRLGIVAQDQPHIVLDMPHA